MLTRIKSDREIILMRESGKMLASVLGLLEKKLEPEITTQELADIARAELAALGGKPAFLDYEGFPDVLCVSINDEVVHGIPSSKRKIRAGDIVGLDFGVEYQGMITDAAISVIAGGVAISSKVEKLVKATKESLYAGIDLVRNGVHVGDIGSSIQQVLDKYNLGVVRDLVGHGVGHHLHEEPNIPNYGHAGSGPTLQAGMTVAIEPMATLGDYKVFIDLDGWTVRTADKSWAAHFEHTVLVTEHGSEILTAL